MYATASEEQIQSLLLADHSDVADEMRLAAAQLGARRQRAHAREVGAAAHDEYLRRVHMAALDGDPPIGLVGRDTHIGGGEGPTLETTQKPVPDVAATKLRLVELGVDVVMIEYEALAEHFEEAADQEDRVGRITGVDDIEAARAARRGSPARTP